MKPVWFRIALMSLASCVVSFAAVDAVLWARLKPETSLHNTASAPIPAPEPAPDSLAFETAAPAPSRRAGRSLFETIADAKHGESDKPATVTTDSFVLRGAVITAGRRRALIAADADAPGVWVEPGEVVGGYLVASITPSGVRISRDGVSIWLTLGIEES